MSFLTWLGLKPKMTGVDMHTGLGTHLVLGRMLGSVIVVFDQTSNQFSIEVGGNEEYAAQVTLHSDGEHTTLSCPVPFLGKVPWGMSGTGRINGQFVVDGYFVDESKKVEILVHAPNNCTITADGILGETHVKNTHGNLSVINKSMCAITIGDVGGNLYLENDTTQPVRIGTVSGDLSVMNSSAGQCIIARVVGNVSVNISGTGDVTLQNGDNPYLRIITDGPGKFTHQGGVASIEVYSYSTGDVTVNNALGNNIECSMQSSGKVSISNGVCGDLNLEVAGTGDFRFSGNVNGDIACTQTAPGKVYISGGDSPNLTLRSHGTGLFEFNGNVTQLVDVQLTAPGKATIAGGNCELVKAIVSGTGNFAYLGHAVDALLRTSGPGGITVKSVKNPPDQRSTGTGKIKLG